MAQKLNSEFNYRYLVQGETAWAKIQTLQGFLVGRKRAAVLEEVGSLKLEAKREELKYLQKTASPVHLQLNLKAEIIEIESHTQDIKNAYELNRQEISILEKLLAELYAIAEPTRILGYTDEQMYEANAANEFTHVVGREIQSEIIANGRPSPAKLHNAMSNPYTFKALQDVGLIPKEAALLLPNNDPLRISLSHMEDQNVPTQ
jgi:hypothetical protein